MLASRNEVTVLVRCRGIPRILSVSPRGHHRPTALRAKRVLDGAYTLIILFGVGVVVVGIRAVAIVVVFPRIIGSEDAVESRFQRAANPWCWRITQVVKDTYKSPYFLIYHSISLSTIHTLPCEKFSFTKFFPFS